MLKYNYCLKDKNMQVFHLVSDNREIEEYLQAINGVYGKLVLVLQKNNITKEIKEYLVHNNNGVITEYMKVSGSNE